MFFWSQMSVCCMLVENSRDNLPFAGSNMMQEFKHSLVDFLKDNV